MKGSCSLYIAKYNYSSDDLEKTVKDVLIVSDNIEYSTKELSGLTWTIRKNVRLSKSVQYHYAINYNDKCYEIDYEDMDSGKKYKQCCGK